MSKRRCNNWINAYLEYTASLESPDSYHIWCGLSVAATYLRRTIHVDMGSFNIYSNMYIVLVSPPGKCRKSIAINAATGLISNEGDVRVSADAITREALIREIKKSEVMVATKNDKMYIHASLTIVSKELSVFLGTGNHDLLSLLTDLYDAPERWSYKTKNKGTDDIRGVWLNMLAASTPTWLCGSIPLTAIGGGFTSRVMFVVEDEVRHRNPRPTYSSRELQLKEDLMYDLDLMSELKGEIGWTKEGGEFYDNWYLSERKEITDSRFAGYVERKHVHIIKAAMIISACSGDSMMIDKSHLEYAMKIITNIEDKMVGAFGAIGRSAVALDIDELLHGIKAAKRITRRQLMRGTWINVSPRDFDIAMGALETMGRVKITFGSNGITYDYIEED